MLDKFATFETAEASKMYSEKVGRILPKVLNAIGKLEKDAVIVFRMIFLLNYLENPINLI